MNKKDVMTKTDDPSTTKSLFSRVSGSAILVY